MAYVEYHLVHHLLTLDGAVGIDAIECILLQDHEVQQLALPETLVILDGHTVITQDVDLVVSLLTTLYDSLTLVNLANPILADVLVKI